jgi:hypothetical protein
VSDVPTAADSKRANHETLFLVSTYGGEGDCLLSPTKQQIVTHLLHMISYVDFAFDWCLGLKQARSE